MAALQATTRSIAAVKSCFVTSDVSRQLLATPSDSVLSLPRLGGDQYPSVRCGRGDKRTAKGKRFRGSFGNARPKNADKGRGLAITPLPPRPPKKDIDDVEYVKVDLDESLFTN